MIVSCPHCGNLVDVRDKEMGRDFACPLCKQPFVAGDRPQGAAPPPVPPATPPPLVGFISPMPRARWALGFVTLAILMSLISCWSSGRQLDLLNRAQHEGITQEEAEANDSRETMIGLLGMGATIGALVFFWVWTYRAYKNLLPLGAEQVRFSPGGSVGWYFCPILNFWKPCQAMNDIWVGSQKSSGPSVLTRGSGFVLLWWLAWVGSEILGQASFRVSMSLQRSENPSIESLVSSTWLTLASEASSILCWTLLIPLVWLISTRQLAMRQEAERASLPGLAL